ncbi:hypothetical protein [Nitrospirillum sp. BR 11163]|uniref:hypothetical protein n=1 Tax=Nitrospirillum sp. BR 11163 TaxID=3104323 RepID=UPI002AFE1551|nr:hypothetical protein [Nitrospirillum sp. BR 11163]MEA1672794.1 hypothetical protein [Nitrospirillum sp. BR 11163]
MSLYYLQKLLYTLNRDPKAQTRFRKEQDAFLAEFDLDAEEAAALRSHDIGKLYVLGVNGQILMHFAAFCGIAWADYLQMMRDGIRLYGPVRAGVYTMTTGLDEKVAGI